MLDSKFKTFKIKPGPPVAQAVFKLTYVDEVGLGLLVLLLSSPKMLR